MSKQQIPMVLWATRKGAPDGQEDVITETTDRAHLDRAAKWARENGFDRLRVMLLDGSRPDFVAAINKRRRPTPSTTDRPSGKQDDCPIDYQRDGSKLGP